MRILAIETSCDDTAISLVEAEGELAKPHFRILSHQVSSQIKIHEEWGGVVPMLAKREHGKNLVPLLLKVMESSKYTKVSSKQGEKIKEQIEKILEREPELKEAFFEHVFKLPPPKIDTIAVTEGPGLEPALWVGINFARALSVLWNKPLMPVNHMEGHIYASLAETGEKVEFPALALLVSGGHTELVLMRNWLKYEILGQTRDDAVGEAFDKVARILGLPYPGGPQISRLAALARTKTGQEHRPKPDKESQIPSVSSLDASAFKLPRPMINSNDFDFSFSGLKTAVLYLVKKIPALTDDVKASIAREFENAVIEVLTEKTKKAIETYAPQTLILGGGVSANELLRENFEKVSHGYPDLKLLIPNRELSTDNATMIAIAGYFHLLKNSKKETGEIKAQGNLTLGK